MAKKQPGVTAPDLKSWLRRALIRRRQRLSTSRRLQQSRRIIRHLLKSSFYKKSHVIASFIGFASEVITDGFIQQAWKDGKKVLVPMTSQGFAAPFFVLFNKGDEIRRTPHGPFELIEKKTSFNFSEIDLVLVPGLGFDDRGNRVGYGGGVYDRILERTPKARHIGLFFGSQRLRRVPVEKHDRPLQAIVTEKGVSVL